MLRTQLTSRELLLLDGKFFHVWCCSHILNLIVQDGLRSIDPSVVKIRECLKYITGSMARTDRFWRWVQQVGLGGSTKGLRQDVPTRWNSTYTMLESALFYKRSLIHYALVDMEFRWCPSSEEWVKLQQICKFLGLFHDVTLLFSGSQYPTASLFFPKIVMVQQNIRDAMGHEDEFMKQMGAAMNAKFDKYWKNYSVILGIAVVLDPRWKLVLVKWTFEGLYGENSDEFKTFKDTLKSLFNVYVETWSPEDANGIHSENWSQHESEDAFFQDFDATYKSSSTSSGENELQAYLNEDKLDRRTPEFNVLSWWNLAQHRYPVLSKMARDLMTIPISTVASESAFSVAGNVLDQNRTPLSPKTVEALICYRDWLFGKRDADSDDWQQLSEDVLNLSHH